MRLIQIRQKQEINHICIITKGIALMNFIVKDMHIFRDRP
jgi:hypothetical protein